MSDNKPNDSTDHTLQDQLIARMEALLQHKQNQFIEKLDELTPRKQKPSHDQEDIETAFEADKSWSGQHERLTARSTKGWGK